MNLDALSRRFSYDPLTGEFHWLSGRHAGSIAGSLNDCGYRILTVGARSNLFRCKAHRAAWLFVHGCWPVGVIDHINGKPDDNRIANLRDVDARANAQNRRRVRSDSAIGFQCVERQGDRFRAIVCDGPVRHRSHTYSTAHEAHLAAMAMKRALHSAFEG